MSLKVNNTKPSGTVAKDCDAGTPIMGRTANNGTYEILKVNSDGSLPITPTYNPINTFGAAYFGKNPQNINVPLPAPPANTYLGRFNVPLAGFNLGGLYEINPVFIFSYVGALTGGVNFVLFEQGSNMDNYINLLTPGNTFAPSIADLPGVYQYWHNTAAQNFGAGLGITFNRNNTLKTFLPNANYEIAIITEGALSIQAGLQKAGFYELTQLA